MYIHAQMLLHHMTLNIAEQYTHCIKQESPNRHTHTHTHSAGLLSGLQCHSPVDVDAASILLVFTNCVI